MLRSAAETAIAARLGPVVIVLGAVEEPCRQTLHGLDATIAVNAAWADGPGGTIACGMASHQHQQLDAVIVMLCDQPAVSRGLLTGLAETQRSTGAEIVASSYADTVGVPALFTMVCFPALLALRGTSGAKALITDCPRLATLPFPGGALDIDEPAQLADLDRFRD